MYITYAEEQEKIIKQIEQKNNITYISLTKQEQEKILEGKKMNQGILYGIPSLEYDRETYYKMITYYKASYTFDSFFPIELSDRLEDVQIFEITQKNYKNIKIADKGCVYFVSVGNKTADIITELYLKNPNNSYIDITYCRHPSKDEHQFDLASVNMDVTVVMTLFKRPEVLIDQLDAICRQSLKPREILLFQDMIPQNYRVQLMESVLARFDNVQIADHNIGVWGHFDFARTASPQYVCLFDDDTIQGSRWLENCHYHIQQREGIYATIGIVLTDYGQYPYDKYYRIGWTVPNEIPEEVDFAGHAWFVKKEWLEYMFIGSGFYQKIKYAAEDMCLFVMSLKNGIRTFTPPHPKDNLSLWGSLPESACELGNSKVATGIHGNYPNMNKAIKHLQDDEWKPLYKRNPEYIKEQQKRCHSFYRKCKRNMLKERLYRIIYRT